MAEPLDLTEFRPATDGLIEQLRDGIVKRREHQHTREDWFCLNLMSYAGERLGPVLRRLADAEAEVERLRAELAQARADRRAYRDEARRRSNEDLTLRGILSPADRPTARPIPFELGPSLADALNYLVARSEALDKVMLLVEAVDPQHHVPADGTLIVATYPDGQEHAFERVDVATVEDGEWWEVGADHPTPYGVILGHDEPPQDRLVVVIETYVSLAHLRSALDGAS